MKIKFYIFLALAFLISKNAFNQGYNVKYGATFKEPWYYQFPLLETEDGIFAYGEFYTTFNLSVGIVSKTTTVVVPILTKFDQKLNFKKGEKAGDEKVDGVGGRERSFFINTNDDIYIFTADKKNSIKKYNLIYQTINKSTLKPNNNPQTLKSVSFDNDKMDYFSYRMSPDSSKIMVIYNIPTGKNEKERFGLTVFDNTMNQLWEGQFTVPYEDKLFDIGVYLIDNEGNAYISGLVYDEKRKTKVRGEANYSFSIFTIQNSGSDFIENKISLDGKFITDFTMKLNNAGDLLCAGLYTNDYKASFTGVFSSIIDKNNPELKDVYTQKIEAKYLTKGYKKGLAKKITTAYEKGYHHILLDYDLREVISTDDGSVILLAEQYDVKTSSSNSSSVVSSEKTYYYFRTILIVCIDKNGEVKWVNSIPKIQASTNLPLGYNYASFSTVYHNSNLYVFYNDNPKNFALAETAAIKGATLKSDLIMAKIDNSGKITKKVVHDNVKYKTCAYPYQAIQTGNHIYMVCYSYIPLKADKNLMKIEITD